MRLSGIALTTLLVGLVSAPALAAMQPVGSVELWPVYTHTAATYGNLTGDIVALTARGNADVGCRAVTATFADGSAAEIFHGVLAPDDQFKVYLPGGTRNVRRVDFDCVSVDRGHAMIDIAADVVPVAVIPVG